MPPLQQPANVLEPQPPPPDRDFIDHLADCFACVPVCCERSWNYIKDSSIRAWNWLSEHARVCCKSSQSDPKSLSTKGKQIKSKKSVLNTRQGSTLSAIRSTDRSPPSRIRKRNSKESLIRKRSHESRDGLKAASSQIPRSSTGIAAVPSNSSLTKQKMTDQGQQQQRQSPNMPESPQTQQSISSNSSIKTTSTQRSTASDASVDSHKSTISLESPKRENKQENVPPKIDFVETGSIFGHRRRNPHANLLLLENGRFRSPGMPNVTTTPNGRPIRISFQTGFPSIKSIESRASLQPPIGKSRSNESDQQQTSESAEDGAGRRIVQGGSIGGATVISTASVGSGGFQPAVTRRKRRSTSSRRPVKSCRSRETNSRENEQALEDVDTVEIANDQDTINEE